MRSKGKKYITKIKTKTDRELERFNRGFQAYENFERKVIPQKRIYYVVWYLILTLILSLVIPMSSAIIGNISEPAKWFHLKNYKYSVILFFSLIPLIVTVRKNVLFKDGPLKALSLIFYYIIAIPLLNYLFLGTMNASDGHEGNLIKIINLLNIFLLFGSHVVLFKYTFTDIFLKKRRIQSRDIIITFLCYITLAVSFGFVYFLISLGSSEPAFAGLKEGGNTLYFYFQHIYFSFMTITTVGYGDLSPNLFITQLIAMIEVITGVALLNFSLGITLGSGVLNFSSESSSDKNSW